MVPSTIPKTVSRNGTLQVDEMTIENTHFISKTPFFVNDRILARDNFDEEMRQKFLQWAISMRALPPGGLQEADERISLKCTYAPDGDERLPVASTCHNILTIPDYSCLQVVQRQLSFVLEAYEADGGVFHML